ncbi:MAG: MFS transporter [Halobacteriales archaeon]|nr:MFS transporter [Halobacteriales archaeon]
MRLRSVRGLVAVSSPRRVWLITGAHAVNEFYSVALPPILHLLVADFDITLGQAGALLTVFYAMYSVFQLPAGALADRLGKKPVLGAGMVVLAAGIFLAAQADSYLTLVGAQALAGIGGSTYHPSGMSLISDLESGATEGKAMGIHGLGGVAGTAMAPAIIGGLAVLFDWRTALMAGAAVGVAYAAVFVLWFPSPDDGAAPEAAADGGSPERGGLRARARDAVNVPLAWWVVGLFVANLLISLEIGAVRTFAASYLVLRTGGSTAVSNAVFFVMLAGGGVASLGAGSLADRMDRRTLGVGVLALSALALAATAAVPEAPLALTAWFFLLGVILYAAFPALNALTSAYAKRGFSGSLFGVMLTAGALGGAGGPLLVGVVAERLGLVATFPLIAAVSVAGLVAFLGLYRV